jgi:hypothetical protein
MGQILQHIAPQVAQLQTNFVYKIIMVLAFWFQHLEFVVVRTNMHEESSPHVISD